MILDETTGRSPSEVLDMIKAEFTKEFNGRDPLTVEEIRGMNVTDLMLKYGATQKEVSCIRVILFIEWNVLYS